MKKLTQRDAYKLMHQGALALADVEANGIRIDIDYCQKQNVLLEREIKNEQDKLEETKEAKKWRGIYGNKTNYASPLQNTTVFFKHMGYKPHMYTAKGRASVNEESLKTYNTTFTKGMLKIRKLQKTKDTFLAGIIRETTDNYLHPFFNLHTVRTFRSSSDSPNFQNIPIRDKLITKIIRRAFIPRSGQQLIEIDYSSIEVRIASCYHKDPNMLQYIKDPTKDLHRDMAMECYCLSKSELTKEIRFWGKSGFVFPQFYGDYYVNCAKSMWEESNVLQTKQRIPLKRHLKDKGFNTYSKFENHIKQVEKHFWNKRFKVYTQWKEDWYNQYLKKGYIDMLTGFRCSGLLSRNDAINYPIQGSAFHCLLWSLIQLNKWMKKEQMKSTLIGQIHDSIVIDVVPEELDEILQVARRIMCVDIRKCWSWIIVPLDIDIEVSPINASWYKKEKYAITN